MKKLATVIVIATVSMLAASTYADVGLNVTAADLQDNTGALMNINGLVIFTSVGLNGTGAFADGSLLPSADLTVGGAISAQEQVIIRTTLDSGGGPGVFQKPLTLELGSGFLTNGALIAMYWFPTLTTADTTVGNGTQYGYFRTDAIITADGANAPWVLPNDTSLIQLAFLTVSEGGSQPTIDGRASLTTAAAIPEPSTIVLVGMGVLGMLAVRRQRRG